MTTIHNLQMLAVDLEQRTVREMQLSGDAERQILEAMATAKEALEHLDVTLRTAFQERNRALAAMLGIGKPNPDTIEGHTKPSNVKKLRVDSGDTAAQ